MINLLVNNYLSIKLESISLNFNFSFFNVHDFSHEERLNLYYKISFLSIIDKVLALDPFLGKAIVIKIT